MPQFQYTALKADGTKLRGTLTADSEAQLHATLEEQNLDLVRCRRVRFPTMPAFFREPVRTRDLIEFCINMEELLGAGVSILVALTDIRDTARSARMRDALTTVAVDVGNGAMLSAALARHPKVFSRIFIGVISAGERSGSLEDSFRHLGAHYKWQDELNTKLHGALRYPIVVLITTLGLAVSLLIFLVPQLRDFLNDLNIPLPWYTVALLQLSEFVQAYWEIILGVFIFFVIAIRTLHARSDTWARTIDYYAFQIPVIGDILRKIALSRFAHFFTLMYSSGVSILECMEMARAVVANRALSASLGMARQRVEGGSSLTDALKVTGEFPDLVTRMIRVGEDSGKLDRSLRSVSYFYDRDIHDAVERLVGSVQPALTAIMGALLLWIIIAIFGPIYDSFSALPI